MNKSLFRFSLVLAILVVAQPDRAIAQSGNRSMFDWGSGTTASYNVVQSQTQVLEIPGQGPQESSTVSTTNMQLEAKNSHEFKLTIIGAEVTGAPISVDPLIGMESDLVIGADGVIVSATGLEGNAYIEQNGGEEVFRESLQALFQVLPEQTLAAGVSWSRKVTLPISRMGLDLERTVNESYTCKQKTTYEGTEAFEIALETDVSMSGSGNQGGGEMSFSMDGKLTGTTYIDAKTGRLLSSEYGGGMAGVIDMAQGSLPMTIDLTVSAKLAE